MELMVLDSNFQPVSLIENYESLIWTERYSQNGDFELSSSNMDELTKLLPPGVEKYVALRDSTVPMIVENHKIKKSLTGSPLLTITGRTFETVLERRASVNSIDSGAGRPAWTISATKASDAAFRAIRTVIGDVAQTKDGKTVLLAATPAVSNPNDAIPEITLRLPADYQLPNWGAGFSYSIDDIVVNSGSIYKAILSTGNLNKQPSLEPTFWTLVSSTLPSNNSANGYLQEITPKDLYTAVMELVTSNHHGMKAVRPISGESTVDIEIYNGADLTDSVVFDARFDQFSEATYLLSNQGSTNIAYVYGPTGSSIVQKTTTNPSGLARRVLVVESTDESTNNADVRNSRGLIELYKYNATALFDGELASQVIPGYNTVYFLGDIVNLVGEYNLSQPARIAEFIRTSDNTGEKAYPTFEAVT